MTDFGQLDEQLDAYDISFTFKGKEYHLSLIHISEPTRQVR